MKLAQITLRTLLAGLLIGGAYAAPAPVQPTSSALTPAQTKQVEQIVHDYLLQNPNILIEMSQKLQTQRVAQMEQQAQTAIKQHAHSIFSNVNSPVVGNPNGNINLVEFLDYQCGHCKSMAAVVDQLMKNNPNLRVVFKELPIFGENSQWAAKAALASEKQGKYSAFHNALLAAKDPLSPDAILKIAQSVGLDTKQLQADMQSKAIEQELQDNVKLAQEIGIMGTPAFILANRNGNTFSYVPGAIPLDALQAKLAQLQQ